MVLWNSFLKNLDPVAVPMPVEAGLRTWDEAFQAQQHYWNEWFEAGQLWMSWWVSALPPMPWLPTGQVVSAVRQPAAIAVTTNAMQPPDPPMANLLQPKPVVGKPRSVAARQR